MGMYRTILNTRNKAITFVSYIETYALKRRHICLLFLAGRDKTDLCFIVFSYEHSKFVGLCRKSCLDKTVLTSVYFSRISKSE